jgi:hypothetical protein
MPFLAAIPLTSAILGSAAIGGGASVLGSALGSRDKTTTVKTTLPPELQSAQDSDLSYLTGVRDNPDGGLGPIKAAGQDQINRNYAQLPQLATTKLAARGFGSSGSVGDAVYDTEGARLGDLSGLFGQMAKMGSDRQRSAAQMIQNMISAGRGTSTTTPGNVAGNAFSTAGNGLDTFSSITMLMAMLQNGGKMPGPTATLGSIFGGGASPVSDGTGWI